MIQPVSTLSIVGMLFTLTFVFALPIVTLIIVKKNTHASLISTLIGAGTFIVFALILEQILHTIVIAVFGDKLTGNILLYALYGGLAAALFEEGGRWLSMKLLMKRRLTKGDALLFGVGHGGAEAILLIGMTYISNLVLTTMINSGNMDPIIASVPESQKELVISQLVQLSATPAFTFFLASAERLAAFALQVCLSYLVYRAVRMKKLTYWVLAFVIHFAVDAGIALLSSVASVFAVEGALIAVVAILCVCIVNLYRREEP